MNKSQELYLTPAGRDKLAAELKELTTVKRKQIAHDLKAAKENGDLSENGAWDAARAEQGFVEGRITELEHILKHAKIIEGKASDAVTVGSTVVVELESGQQQFQIVGSTEADASSGRISNESPIGQALLGRKKGEEVKVKVPAGTMTYKIVDVR